MSNFMIVWTVKKERTRCTFECLSDAWADWLSHDGKFRTIYPKIIGRREFYALNEFKGW